MSQNYGAVPPSNTTDYESGVVGHGSPGGVVGGSSGDSSRTEAAKHEAADLKDTARAEAGHVAETAKHEASAVAHETKAQAKQVYAQTRRELTDQAATQQQRVAEGLRSIGDELQSMARGSENPGMATEFVEMASTRLSDASSWLSQRDPGSLMHEVKTFARRKPGMFIAGALVAGLAAGRLTRALAENAKDEHDASGSGVGSTGTAGTVGTPSTTATPGTVGTPGSVGTPGTVGGAAVGSPAVVGSEPAPMYDQTRAANPAAEPGFTPGGVTGEARDGL